MLYSNLARNIFFGYNLSNSQLITNLFTYFSGMKSSQKSESMNSFFDGYVNSNTPLSEFIEQYEKAIASRRDAEEKEDLISMTTAPDFTNMHSIEAHAG